MPFATRSLASALAGAATVAAHGFVSNVVINGVSYSGYDVTKFPYQPDPPAVIGWTTTATDTGFVAPSNFSGSDIICHRGGENAQAHAEVAAGDSIYLQWNTWPESHHGPVLDYLASCGDAGCEKVDKTTLEFFKIDQVGLEDGSAAPGLYGSDDLIKNNNGWMVKIPEDIAPGNYVLRHEIIALHSAGQEDGAQNYPQCFNLQVTGSGTKKPAGVVGTELYKPDDEGILFNIYTALSSYPVPGPTVIAGASAVAQSTSAIKATGTATTGSGSAPTGTTAPEPTADPEPSTTAAPSEVPASSADNAPSATETTAKAKPTKDACRAKKRSRKVRRHARDTNTLNIAPIRL